MGDDYEKDYKDLASAYQQASASAKSAVGRRMARADYDVAVRDVAMRQQSALRTAQPQTQKEPASKIAGIARSASQGFSFGLADEAEAAARSLLPNRTYAGEVGKVRGELAQFREENPKTALVSEIAGGLFTPGLGAAGAVRAGRTAVAQGGRIANAAQAVARPVARSAALQGALAGAGSAEGGVAERGAGAVIGGLTGGVVGGTLGAATGAVARRASRRAQGSSMTPDVGVADVVAMAQKANIKLPAKLREAAQTGSPETRVMDVLGVRGVRRAAGIRTIGGDAGASVEEAMQDRLARTPERLQRAAFSTGRRTENVVEAVEDLVRQREAASRPLYESTFQNAAPIVDGEIETLLNTPLFSEASKRAERIMQNNRIKLEYLDTPAGRVPVRTPEFLDNVKKALDGLIYEGRLARNAEGGIGPAELRQAKMLRGEFVDMLDANIPGYADARAAFAGPTALKDAFKSGLESATERVSPEQLAADVADLEPSEREFFQRGYINALRLQIDDNALKPAAIRTPAFTKRMQAVFGNEGVAVAKAVNEEVGLSATAQRVVGGSQTAANQADRADLAGTSRIGDALRFVLNPRTTFPRFADVLEGRATAGLNEGRRQAIADVLLTPVRQSDDIRNAIRREYLARVFGTAGRNVAATAAGRFVGGESVRRSAGQ